MPNKTKHTAHCMRSGKWGHGKWGHIFLWGQVGNGSSSSDLFHGISNSRVRRLPSQVIETALYKLDLINAAQTIDDLRSPSGNRLEILRGDLKGFHSIRINLQWRIIFLWQGSNADDVKIVDYH